MRWAAKIRHPCATPSENVRLGLAGETDGGEFVGDGGEEGAIGDLDRLSLIREKELEVEPVLRRGERGKMRVVGRERFLRDLEAECEGVSTYLLCRRERSRNTERRDRKRAR